ncbi:hypothetical protein M569_15329 [Genlisea aurea]|uniref:Transmembrane protein n=1 Tax=Genlisea aurea TaxID=192259 RepID=S8BYL0_9LAMI|nr:hypothetical protein M569_15329 [Genlisea aurea]
MASQSGVVDSAPNPPQPIQKEPFIRRYRFLWPVVLAVNLGIGAYVLVRTTSKGRGTEVGDAAETETPHQIVAEEKNPATVSAQNPIVEEQRLPVLAPHIPEVQQRELFRWILEEKRKLKPRDAQDKKRIDEEKSILKNLIRSESVPNF